MKLIIGLLVAIIGLPLISMAESDNSRITKLEEEVKNLKEANQELLKKTSEKPETALRRRAVPVSPKPQTPDKDVEVMDPQKTKMFVGEWRMSSWGGHYELFENGRITISSDGKNPNGGHWFLAYDRLYLVFLDAPVVNIFKLNKDNNMTLQRIDSESEAGVTFQKK